MRPAQFMLVQAGMQANQLSSMIDCAGNINFLRLKRDMLFIFCVCHKKGVSGKHPIPGNNTYCASFH